MGPELADDPDHLRRPASCATSTPAGVGAQWYDSHLDALGARAPAADPRLGEDRACGAARLADPGAAHLGRPQRRRAVRHPLRAAISTSSKARISLDGDDQLRNITPAGGIVGPSNTLTTGGYGNDAYDTGLLRHAARTSRRTAARIGEIWRLQNWGEDLLAMASTDGRLLRWMPGPTCPSAANRG